MEVLGRLDEAKAVNAWLVARDPLCIVCQLNLVETQFISGDLPAVLATSDWFLVLDPNSEAGTIWKSVVLNEMGDFATALDEIEAVSKTLPYKSAVRAQSLLGLGSMDLFNTEFENLQNRWGDAFPALVARIYARRNDPDALFTWLDRLDGPILEGLSPVHDPAFGPFHDDPRWDSFLRRIGRHPDELSEIPLDFKPLQ